MTVGGNVFVRFARLGVVLALGLAVAGCAGAASTSSRTATLGCGDDAGAAGEAAPTPACTQMPTLPPGSISREAAIAAALRAVPAGGAHQVIWANFTNYPFTDGAMSPGTMVWMVRIAGVAAAAPCPSGTLDRQPHATDPMCLDAEGGVDVVLDIATGAILGWAH